MPPEASDPRVSVLIPLEEHRGEAIRSVNSWLEQDRQSLWACELVVISAGGEPGLEQEVRSLLRPVDRFLRIEEGGVFDCYNAGAVAASSPMLLLTESHIVATAGCLAAVLKAVDGGDLQTAILPSDGLYEDPFARSVDRLFSKELPSRLEQGWDQIVVRGTLVDKRLFESLGGFSSEYGHFAALLFGARMWQAGARTRMVEGAMVLHANERSFAELQDELIKFGRMEVRFHAENPRSPLLERLPECHDWRRRERFTRGLSRLFGRRWRVAKALFHYRWALVRLRLFAWSPSLYTKAFGSAWGGLIRLGRATEVAHQLGLVDEQTRQAEAPRPLPLKASA